MLHFLQGFNTFKITLKARARERDTINMVKLLGIICCSTNLLSFPTKSVSSEPDQPELINQVISLIPQMASSFQPAKKITTDHYNTSREIRAINSKQKDMLELCLIRVHKPMRIWNQLKDEYI